MEIFLSPLFIPNFYYFSIASTLGRKGIRQDFRFGIWNWEKEKVSGRNTQSPPWFIEKKRKKFSFLSGTFFKNF